MNNKNLLFFCFCLLIGCSNLSTNSSTNPQIQELQNQIEKIKKEKGITSLPSPIPSSLPVFGAKVKFSLKAAVIKGSGDIVPVAREDFTAYSYPNRALYDSVKAEISKKNNAGPEPDISDPKYKTKCTNIGSTPFCTTDYDAWTAESSAWRKKDGEGFIEAYSSASAKASNGIKSVSVKTDLKGEAEIELPSGIWYFSGSYSNSVSSVYWTDVKVDVKEGMKTIEFSNDNSSNIFNKN
jgi:hypothetical protein